MGKYQSGQMGQTVNLLAYAFGGSNPSLPTRLKRGSIQNTSSFFVLKSQGLILPDNDRNQRYRYVSWHRPTYYSKRQK